MSMQRSVTFTLHLMCNQPVVRQKCTLDVMRVIIIDNEISCSFMCKRLLENCTIAYFKVKFLPKECEILCFLPEIERSSVERPKERCAGYMGREELTTIRMVQNAYSLCKQVQSGEPFHLNSDGTTRLMVLASMNLCFLRSQMEVLKQLLMILKKS